MTTSKSHKGQKTTMFVTTLLIETLQWDTYSYHWQRDIIYHSSPWDTVFCDSNIHIVYDNLTGTIKTPYQQYQLLSLYTLVVKVYNHRKFWDPVE